MDYLMEKVRNIRTFILIFSMNGWILSFIYKVYGTIKPKVYGTLDVGCGNGQSSTLFSDHFKRVLATDISEAQIITAQGVNHPTNIDFQ